MFRVFRNFKIKVEHNIDLNCSKRQKWFILTSFKKHIQKKEKKNKEEMEENHERNFNVPGLQC